MPEVTETIDKVNQFVQLPNGWHFGEGRALSPALIARAVDFLRAAHGLGIQRTNAFPGVDGQIQITFYRGKRMLEFTLETDNSITLAEDDEDRQILFREDVSCDEAVAALQASRPSIGRFLMT